MQGSLNCTNSSRVKLPKPDVANWFTSGSTVQKNKIKHKTNAKANRPALTGKFNAQYFGYTQLRD